MNNIIVLSKFLIVLLVIFSACKSDKKADMAGDDEDIVKKYILTPFSRSEAFPDAKLENMTYQNGQFSFDVSGSKYKLGEQTPDATSKMCANSAEGQHIHLIVGFQPYVAQYVPSFSHPVADGEHNVLAFLSRSYHESIKTPDAHIAKRITVANGSITDSKDITQPSIFYSRPKGTYVGDDTKKIMLDFYPLNADIGKDYLVKVQINGEVTLLDEWKPYYIEGLPYGQNSIGLALVYKDGTPVAGNQTSTLQRITLAENAPPAE